MSANSYYVKGQTRESLLRHNSYHTSVLRFTYGISRSALFNVGLDVGYTVGTVDYNKSNSAFEAFKPGEPDYGEQRSGLTMLSVSARYAVTPNKNFVIQHTYYLPFRKSTGTSEFLGTIKNAFVTQSCTINH